LGFDSLQPSHGIAGNQFGHDTTYGLNAQGQGCDIQPKKLSRAPAGLVIDLEEIWLELYYKNKMKLEKNMLAVPMVAHVDSISTLYYYILLTCFFVTTLLTCIIDILLTFAINSP